MRGRAVVVVVLLLAACGQVSGVHRAPRVEPASPVATRASVAPVPSETPSPARNPFRPAGPKPKHSQTKTPHASTTPGLSAYRGLGTWIDVYSQANVFGPGAFGHARAIVHDMVAHGVRTLFLQAGSYRHPAVTFPAATARIIDAAHAAGLKVVGWYLPLFRNVRYDLHEVLKTIRFRTPDGQGYDGFALDIEADLVSPARRIANFLKLSAEIRRAVGPSYSLGAIIPSPRGLIRVPSYWPGFPYTQLSRYYDVVLPMSYFTFHYHGAGVTYRYIRDNIEIIRRATGDPAIPIHVIGGISDDMSLAETKAFVRAIETEHAYGASLYEFPGTSNEEWRVLAALR